MKSRKFGERLLRNTFVNASFPQVSPEANTN